MPSNPVMLNACGPKAKLFVASLMQDGARSRAERIFAEAMETVIHGGFGLRSVAVEEVLTVAIENMRPWIAVETRRIGGLAYKVPVTIPEKRGTTVAIHAIIDAARRDKGAPMSWRLAKSLLSSFRGD